MAFREVAVFEVREVLRLWMAGEGYRWIDRLGVVDRKTAQTSAFTPPGGDPLFARAMRNVERQLAKYRTILEQQADITSVRGWIAEVERETKRLERLLGRKPTARNLTLAEVKALVG